MALCSLLLLAIPACQSSGEYVEPPSNSEMVSETKQLVNQFVAEAEKNLQTVKANAAGLAESVEAIEDPALDSIKVAARNLANQASSGASESEIKTTLAELKQKAAAL